MIRRSLAALVFFALSACGASTEAGPAGDWDIDTEAFVEAALPVMEEAGRIPAGAEAQARRLLSSVRMKLELHADQSFSCRMGISGKASDFTGTWSSSGKFVSLVQTHEDGEPKDDTMTGTLRGDMLVLKHQEEGMEMSYTLRRSAVAAPR